MISPTLSPPISELLSVCLAVNPFMSLLLKNHGAEKLGDYYRGLFSPCRENSCPVSREALSLLESTVTKYLGSKVGALVVDEYSKRSRIDTALHAGLITEPAAFQGTVMGAFGASNFGAKVQLSFACSAVRLNNVTYPRGLLIKGKRYPIFRNDDEQRLTFSCPPYDRVMVDRVISNFKKSSISLPWLSDALLQGGALLDRSAFPYFVDQTVMVNDYIFSHALQSIKNAPRVVVLPLEDFTRELLLQSFEKRDLFYDIIFHSDVRDKALQVFDHIKGAWTGTALGNQFFVGANEKGDQTALYVDGDYLVGRDREFRLKIEPSEIISALNEKRICPGVFLSLQLLIDHGILPAGGYFQAKYLPEMQQRMSKFLDDFLGKKEASNRICSLAFGAVSYGMTYVLDGFSPGGIDLALKDPKSFGELTTSLLSSLTVEQGVMLNLPQVYAETVHKSNQSANLKAISSEAIAKELSLRF